MCFSHVFCIFQMSDVDEIVLSSGDIALRKSDLELLSPHHWLNDTLITFAVYKLWKDSALYDKVHVFGPVESELIKYSDAKTIKEAIIGTVKLASKELVVFVVNNNDDPSKAHGGSHWSLMVFNRRTKQFVRLDSMNGTNDGVAKSIATKMNPFLCLPTRSPSRTRTPSGSRTSQSAPSPLDIVSHNCPQQTNYSDCGMYVIEFVRQVLNNGLGSIQTLSLSPESMYQARRDWITVIEKMAAKNNGGKV